VIFGPGCKILATGLMSLCFSRLLDWCEVNCNCHTTISLIIQYIAYIYSFVKLTCLCLAAQSIASEISFFPLELKKTSFLAIIFKIQGDKPPFQRPCSAVEWTRAKVAFRDVVAPMRNCFLMGLYNKQALVSDVSGWGTRMESSRSLTMVRLCLTFECGTKTLGVCRNFVKFSTHHNLLLVVLQSVSQPVLAMYPFGNILSITMGFNFFSPTPLLSKFPLFQALLTLSN